MHVRARKSQDCRKSPVALSVTHSNYSENRLDYSNDDIPQKVARFL